MRVVYFTRMPVARDLIAPGIDAIAGVELEQYAELDDLLRALPDAEGLVTFDTPAPIARKILDAATAPGATLRFMHVISAGRDGYEAAGIPSHLHVTGADGAHSPTVAEHALALMLALVRNIPQAAAMTGKGAWDRGVSDGIMSLEGRTILVIGAGAIGRTVAARARLFSAHMVGVSRDGAPRDGFDEMLPLSKLDEALPSADIVVIAIALADATRGLLSASRLRAMKKGALLINIARGAIVDGDELLAALNDGHLGGAGLDVTDPEPLPEGHPLWTAKNVLISPHLAGFGSPQSIRRMADAAINAVKRQLPGA